MSDRDDNQTEDQPVTGATFARLTSGGDGQATAEGVVGGIGSIAVLLGIVGLLLWGLFSIGSCTVRGVQNITRDGQELQAQIKADEAAAKHKSGDPAYSDTVVTAGAVSAVKRKLVDPGSARFRNVRVYPQSSGTKAVCGEVNAKNRAGGYNGYERFVSAGTDKYTWLERGIEDFGSSWGTICK